MKLFHTLCALLTGKNSISTPKEVIVDQMTEPRPLPMGRKEFEEWSERIIAGTLLAGGQEDPQAFIDMQKGVLASMILHLGPTESHKPDAFFIHSLRKSAANEIAHSVFKEYQVKVKEKAAAKEKANEGPSPDTHIVYEDVMPSKSAEFKASHAAALATEERINRMRFEAAMRGQWLTLTQKVNENQDLFQEPIRAKKENLPSYKFKDLPKE